MSDDTAPEPESPRHRVRASVLVFASHISAAFFFLAPAYIRPDSVGVFAWLRSSFFDRDLLFFNEWEAFRMMGDGFAFFKETTAAGALANHWWTGASLLSAPFYAIARVVAAIFPATAPLHDGFFGIYGAVLSWTAVLFVAIALWIADQIMRRLGFSAVARVVAHCGVWSGTPLFWYELRMPLGTHAAGVLCVAILTWALWRQIEGEHWELLAGVAAGLAIATRLQHVLLIPGVVYVLWRSRPGLRGWLRAVAGAAAPVAVQALSWQVVYGTPFGPLTRGANLTGVTWMPFRSFALLPVLFSSYHGLFTWSPVVLVAIAGWFAMRRDARIFSNVLFLMFGGELLANAFLDRYWWGGLSFGPRRFVDLAVPFAIGLAVVASRWLQPAAIAVAAASLWSLALGSAAMSGILSLSRDVPPSDLLSAALRGFAPVSLQRLHSPVSDRGLLLLSFLAIAIIVVTCAVLYAAVRTPRRLAAALVIYSTVAAALVLMLWSPTRAHTTQEWKRLRLQPQRAARVGPLLDEHQLLSDELAWLTRTGDRPSAERTSSEIREIERVLQSIP